MSEKEKPMSQEEYTAGMFFLTGQFMGIMSKVKSPRELNDCYTELKDLSDRMKALYLRSKKWGL